MLSVSSKSKVYQFDRRYIASNTLMDDMIKEFPESTELQLEDVPDHVMREYHDFVHLKNSVSNQGFEMLGHCNTQHFDDDFWKVKLHDNHLRNVFHSADLASKNDGYFDLIDVTWKYSSGAIVALRHIWSLIGHEKIVLAGGALISFLQGREIKDLDLFFVRASEEEALDVMKRRGVYHTEGHNVFRTNHSVSFLMETHRGKETILPHECDVQYILRLYSCPSEVVHGFDLDCCGLLYDGSKVWATQRTMYSLNKMMNWFDVERASPSYIYRLSKYMFRGFAINMRFSESIAVDSELMDKLRDVTMSAAVWKEKSMEHYIKYMLNPLTRGKLFGSYNTAALRNMFDKLMVHVRPNIERLLAGVISPSTPEHEELLRLNNSMTIREAIEHVHSNLDQIRQQRFEYSSNLETCVACFKINKFITRPDAFSCLLLSSYFNHTRASWRVSDYGPEVKNDETRLNEDHYKQLNRMGSPYNISFSTGISVKVVSDEETGEKYIPDELFFIPFNLSSVIGDSTRFTQEVRFVKQDPMKQVSSTFNPISIADINRWCGVSPLVSVKKVDDTNRNFREVILRSERVFYPNVMVKRWGTDIPLSTIIKHSDRFVVSSESAGQWSEVLDRETCVNAQKVYILVARNPYVWRPHVNHDFVVTVVKKDGKISMFKLNHVSIMTLERWKYEGSRLE